jgi:hypothetical protein
MPPYDRRVQGAARIIKIAGEDVGDRKPDGSIKERLLEATL